MNTNDGNIGILNITWFWSSGSCGLRARDRQVENIASRLGKDVNSEAREIRNTYYDDSEGFVEESVRI